MGIAVRGEEELGLCVQFSIHRHMATQMERFASATATIRGTILVEHSGRKLRQRPDIVKGNGEQTSLLHLRKEMSTNNECMNTCPCNVGVFKSIGRGNIGSFHGFFQRTPVDHYGAQNQSRYNGRCAPNSIGHCRTFAVGRARFDEQHFVLARLGFRLPQARSLLREITGTLVASMP